MRILLVAAVVVAVALITAVPGLGAVRTRLAHGAADWLVLAAVLRFGSALSYVVAFRAVFAPRMSRKMSYQIAMSEVGLNALVPAGGGRPRRRRLGSAPPGDADPARHRAQRGVLRVHQRVQHRRGRRPCAPFTAIPVSPPWRWPVLVGQLAGEIPVPGGIGVVDGGLIGAMVLYGVPASVAAAGALAYRAIAIAYRAIALAVPTVFGGLAAIGLTHTIRGWSRGVAVPTLGDA